MHYRTSSISKLFLGLAIIFFTSCNSTDPETIVNCSETSYGETIGSTDKIGIHCRPNIVTPDTDENFQLTYLIDFYEADTLSNGLPQNRILENFSIKVFDDNEELIHEGNLDNVSLSNGYYHVWDLQQNGNPYYGFFYADIIFDFGNNRTIGFENTRILSVSCEDLNRCDNFPEQCDFTACITSILCIGLEEPTTNTFYEHFNCK